MATKFEPQVALQGEPGSVRRADAGQRDRWMGPLQRSRPNVHRRVLRVLAVPGEGLALGPGPHDEFEVLVVAGAGLDRGNAVVEVGVVGETHRETGQEPAAADVVEHGVLLGDA